MQEEIDHNSFEGVNEVVTPVQIIATKVEPIVVPSIVDVPDVENDDHEAPVSKEKSAIGIEPKARPNRTPEHGVAYLDGEDAGSDIGAITNGSLNEFSKAIEDLDDSVKGKELSGLLKDRDHPITRLLRSMDNMFNNKNTNAFNNAIKALEDIGTKLSESTNVKKDTISTAKNTSGTLGGKEADLFFAARLRGIRKIYLHSSGFWVTLRAPTIVELQTLMNSVDLENDELGASLGGIHYYCLDAVLKRRFIEFAVSLITSANLPNWDKDGELVKYLSYNDLETLMWAVCTSMYKKGVSIAHVCLNTECRHTRSDIKYDLSKLRLINTDLLNEDAIMTSTSETPVDVEILDAYRNSTLKGNTTVSFIEEDNKITVTTRVPSIKEYIDHCGLILGKIISITNGEKKIKSRKVGLALTSVFINAYTPWIESITISNKDLVNDKNAITSKTQETITSTLDYFLDTGTDNDFVDKMDDFINKSKVSFIGFRNEPCEKCGKKDETAGEFRTWDITSLFFTLLRMK